MKFFIHTCLVALFLQANYFAQPIDVTSNLVLCMPMNGNSNDYSGNNFNGILSGTTPTVNRFGAANSALHFNGTSDFISISTNTAFSAIESSGELTITGWCRVNNWYQGYNVFQIFEKYDGNSDSGWGLGLQNPNTNSVNSGMHFLANIYNQTTYQFIAATSTTFGQWDFYAITWSNATQLFQAYKNGVLVNTVSTNSIQLLPTASAAYIGFSPAGPDEYSDGDIDEVRIYNRSLTGQEIAAIYTLTTECDALMAPVSSFTTSQSQICQGQNITFTDQSTNNPSVWNWQFSGGTPATSTLNTQTVAFNTPGVYSVSLTTANSSGTGNTAITTVTVYPIPQITVSASPAVICVGQPATLTAMGASSYTWNNGPNTASYVVTPLSTTNYTVNASSLNNCTAAAVITQSVSTCTGLSENFQSNGFGIYPNPNNGTFVVNSTPFGSDIQLEIYNLLGQKVGAQNLTGEQTRIQIELPKGLYSYKIIEHEKILNSGKLVVE